MTMPLAGAGSSLAGLAPAGVDTFTQSSGSTDTFVVAPGLPPLPPAVNYDASIKAYTQNKDGTFLPVHPVDQIVQQLLTIPRGSVAAQPTTGQRYAKRLYGIPQAQKQNVALDETNVTLAAVIASGDVTLLSVSIVSSGVNQDFVQVAYVNNRLPPTGFQQPQPVTVPLNTG